MVSKLLLGEGADSLMIIHMRILFTTELLGPELLIHLCAGNAQPRTQAQCKWIAHLSEQKVPNLYLLEKHIRRLISFLSLSTKEVISVF